MLRIHRRSRSTSCKGLARNLSNRAATLVCLNRASDLRSSSSSCRCVMSSMVCRARTSMCRDRFCDRTRYIRSNRERNAKESIAWAENSPVFEVISQARGAVADRKGGLSGRDVRGPTIKREESSPGIRKTKTLCFPAGSSARIASKAKPPSWKLSWAKAASFSSAFALSTVASRWQPILSSSMRSAVSRSYHPALAHFSWIDESSERGHPVRQRAQPARLRGRNCFCKVCALRAGGQDVRAPGRALKMAPRRYGWHNRGYLPHFDGGAITQSITFRLFDSLPKTVLEGWSHELAHQSSDLRDNEMRKRIAAYLDQGPWQLLLEATSCPQRSFKTQCCFSTWTNTCCRHGS